MADRVVPMRGFTAAVAHVASHHPQDRSGHCAVGMDGEGTERRLAITVRHADGTALVVYLSDPALGRLTGLIADALDGTIAPSAPRLVQ